MTLEIDGLFELCSSVTVGKKNRVSRTLKCGGLIELCGRLFKHRSSKVYKTQSRAKENSNEKVQPSALLEKVAILDSNDQENDHTTKASNPALFHDVAINYGLKSELVNNSDVVANDFQTYTRETQLSALTNEGDISEEEVVPHTTERVRCILSEKRNSLNDNDSLVQGSSFAPLKASKNATN